MQLKKRKARARRRRHRVGAGAVLTLCSCPTGADAALSSEARLRAATYQDSDNTSINTLGVTAEGEIPEQVRVGAGYLVDIVSSASVDVVSAATGRFHEVRNEANANVALLMSKDELSASYRYSVENDWRSYAATVGTTVDLADGNATVHVGGTLILNDVGRSHDENFKRTLRNYLIDMSYTQTFDKKTIGIFSFTGSYNKGFQSSPYRYVSTADRRYTFLEREPDERTRTAFGFALRRAVGKDSSVGGSYRFYVDDWGIVGNSAEVRLTSDLTSVLSVSARERFHFQTGASFYKASYDVPLAYMSGNKDLATLWDSFTGGRVAFEWSDALGFDRLGFDFSADVFYFRFIDFPRLPERVGVVGSAGLVGAF